MSTASTPAANASATDRIERSVQINAPRSRVWKAISTADDYGKWFGTAISGPTFTAGQHVKGHMTIKGFEHVMFDAIIERVQPESLMTYRWHPYAVESNVDYSKEERTLVTFVLKDSEDGTLLTVTESGFDKVPPERRLMAFQMNSRGWEGQLRNINQYVTQS